MWLAVSFRWNRTQMGVSVGRIFAFKEAFIGDRSCYNRQTKHVTICCDHHPVGIHDLCSAGQADGDVAKELRWNCEWDYADYDCDLDVYDDWLRAIVKR